MEMVNIASFAKFLMEVRILFDRRSPWHRRREGLVNNRSMFQFAFILKYLKYFFITVDVYTPLVNKFMALLTENNVRFIVVCQKLIRRLKMS